MLQPCNRSACGYTLIEVLMAMLILSIVGVAFLGAVATSFKANDIARIHVAANSLARSELEYVHASAYDNSTWSYILPGGPYPAWDSNHTSLPSGYEGYIVQVSASTIGEPYDSDIQKLTAVVTFQGEEVQRVDTYRARR